MLSVFIDAQLIQTKLTKKNSPRKARAAEASPRKAGATEASPCKAGAAEAFGQSNISGLICKMLTFM